MCFVPFSTLAKVLKIISPNVSDENDLQDPMYMRNKSCTFYNDMINVMTFFQDQPVLEKQVEFPPGTKLVSVVSNNVFINYMQSKIRFAKCCNEIRTHLSHVIQQLIGKCIRSQKVLACQQSYLVLIKRSMSNQCQRL